MDDDDLAQMVAWTFEDAKRRTHGDRILVTAEFYRAYCGHTELEPVTADLLLIPWPLFARLMSNWFATHKGPTP